ncbi:hypothetical protein BB559_000135 [Furculomyces boomerangus]|uniref:Glucose-6-phosphate 1-epimerase n=2 Tax=Harpellales TaxID=61421 RepID=A0A2T9Z641_9FUNG|nr:hypothetical protein BB559_000135 [Furculomyces boomerangus]PWA03363.1 hypothetical protein BB558_000478 [Smittium angustum]
MPVKTTTDNSGKVIKVVIIDTSGSVAVVYNHGATITSWVSQGKERLFLSKNAVFDNQKPIRGGIPIVFPQFGPGDIRQHGIARINYWEFLGYKDEINGVKAKFLLKDSEATKEWIHSFRLTYTILLSENNLSLSLECTNTDTSPFTFTTLLHTYFRTLDVSNVKVGGLKNLKYNDKVTKQENLVEDREAVTVSKSEDRIYYNAPETVIVDLGSNERISIEKKNFNDIGKYDTSVLFTITWFIIVFWNPWEELSKGMSDFGDEEYKEMVCVEAGTVGEPISLEPGYEWKGEMTLTVL